MYKNLAGLAAAAILAIANISGASAAPSGAAMREGGFALAPFSFVKFCLDYPGDCPKSAGPGRIRLTSGRMAELASVNRAVNSSIRPKPDTSALRYWKLNVDAGDCNTYAIQKRHELIGRGWPAAALALTVAKTTWGEGHLVVTVRTDRGDLVLDNLRSNIVSWRQTGYDWIMRQSERNPQYWVELDGGQAGPVYAAADLDDATAVAQADVAPPARKPIDHKLALAALDVGLRMAAAPRAPDVRSLQADAATVALNETKLQAAQASIADLTRWIADNRQAVAPVFEGAVAALGQFIEPSQASAEKPVEKGEREARAADPFDPTLFGFI
ncbi:MAG: transglutaminase-like cysteine peptidase [Roseiarcus sp.]|jgi:predicted transglutaminase-like cysteine proteinase